MLNEKYDIWTRSLSPSVELLKKYKNSEINWNTFKTILFYELKNNIDSVEMIYTLQPKNSIQNITLLYNEKDRCLCHRHMIRDLIEDPRLLSSTLVFENTSHKSTPIMGD